MVTELSPDLLLSQGRQDLESRLSYFLSVGGIAVVSGEPGVGKTLAVQAFVRSLDPRSIITVPLSAPLGSLRAFLRALGLGEHPAWTTPELLSEIQAVVAPWREAQKLLLVTLDEAQDLPQDVLSGLRSLLATPLGEPLPVRILLIGTGALPAHLRSQAMEPIAQRISVRVASTASPAPRPRSSSRPSATSHRRLRSSSSSAPEPFPASSRRSPASPCVPRSSTAAP